MTQLRNVTTTQNLIHTDACGRLRTAQMDLVFEARFNYGDNPALFLSSVENGGTATHDINVGGFNLNTTTANGSRARRVSSRYLPQPMGRSLVMQINVRFAAAKTGLVSRVGWYDDKDGVFIERAADGMYIVKRSYVSGSVVEERVHQDNWNGDKLNGSGPSGVTLNPNAIHVVNIGAAFAGAGGFFLGFTVNKNPIVAHHFVCGNYYSTPIIRPVALPVQFEILNTASTADASSMAAYGLGVFADGPFSIYKTDARRYYLESGSSAVAVSNTAWTPLISITLPDLRNGLKYRGSLIIDEFNVLVNGTNPVTWQMTLNATLSGPVSWTTVSTAPGGSLLIDRGATSFSGGYPLKFGYFNGGTSNKDKQETNKRDADETPALSSKPVGSNDVLTFSAKAMSAGTSLFFSAVYFETED